MTSHSAPETAPTASDAAINADEAAAGIYIHLPFCRTKCPYCAFSSQLFEEQPAADYLAAVRQEVALLAAHPWVQNRAFATLYLGGGTPTIYGGPELAALIALCRRSFRLPADAEITVEANPNTISIDKLRQLRTAGCRRLSIGVQSFADSVLQRIGRSHSAAEAESAVTVARKAGFTDINLDLIYGLPGQTLPIWQETLARALACAPQHLSLYELTVEKGTPFAHSAGQGFLTLPDDETIAAMAALALAQLSAQGLARYEIANFARPGHECRHNRNYWRNGSYLGLGAGAVSCLSGVRLRNVREPKTYIRLLAAGRLPYAEAEILMRAPRFRESVVIGLRQTAGVSLTELEQRFGLDARRYYGPVLKNLQRDGLVEIVDHRLRLTSTGLPVANQALAELV